MSFCFLSYIPGLGGWKFGREQEVLGLETWRW